VTALVTTPIGRHSTLHIITLIEQQPQIERRANLAAKLRLAGYVGMNGAFWPSTTAFRT
jgi:hypothetical protein